MPHKTSFEPVPPVKKKHTVESRFRTISILSFLLMSIVLACTLTWIVRDVSKGASRDYARFYSVETVGKLNAYLSRELSLVAKVALSGALVNWFADEADPARKLVAYEEMMSYTSMLASPALYFGIHASLNEYAFRKSATFSEFKPVAVLDPSIEDDAWYFNSISSKHPYLLNVDIDRASGQRRLWINHKVTRDGGTLGIFCSGLLFEAVIKELFDHYDKSNVRGFVVNEKGVIQMDSFFVKKADLHEYDTSRRVEGILKDSAFTDAVNSHFSNIPNFFTNTSDPKVIPLNSGPYSFVSLAPVVGTNWTVVTLFNSSSLFGAEKLLPLLYAIFAALTVFAAIITFLSRTLLFQPFRRLIESLNRAATNAEEKLFGTDLPNELGDVSRTIQAMRERLATNNEEVHIAMQVAKKANFAKTSFLSNMSHEMRTPLNAIMGMTTLGKASPDMERKDYAFQKIGFASTQLLGVVNDILDMSKIESDMMELCAQDFDFDRAIRKAIKAVSFRVEAKRQHFHMTIDPDIPRSLTGDEQRLVQVLTNLLVNAVKFTPDEGVIRMEIILTERQDDACVVQITIADTGIGIPKEHQARLFHPFHQVENYSSRDFGGAGLGLAISKRIIDLMNGRIWVESDSGKGATFLFTARMELGKKRYELSESLKGTRMLLVDDDAGIRHYFQKSAHGFGIVCDLAATVAEAYALLDAAAGYDIAFLGLNIASMEESGFLQKVSVLSPNTTLVAMVAPAELNAEEKTKPAAISRILPKPLLRLDIAECLAEYLAHKMKLEELAADNDGNVFPGKYVLLAEDIPINQEVCLALLEGTGLKIDCANNGEEALRMFCENENRYDLILMDVQMPKLDGLETTRRIRALDSSKARDIPIIAMTANVFPEDVVKCLRSGMNDHIGKPLDMEVVFAKLRPYLSSKDTSA